MAVIELLQKNQQFTVGFFLCKIDCGTKVLGLYFIVNTK